MTQSDYLGVGTVVGIDGSLDCRNPGLLNCGVYSELHYSTVGPCRVRHGGRADPLPGAMGREHEHRPLPGAPAI